MLIPTKLLVEVDGVVAGGIRIHSVKSTAAPTSPLGITAVQLLRA